LQWYDVINIKAPRGHLKTFFFFETLALNLCRHNAGIEIRYYSGNDSLAVEKLNHIKDLAMRCPYFRPLLIGADFNNQTYLQFSNKSKIFVAGFGSKQRGGHPDYIILDDVVDTQVIYSDEQNKKSKERLAMEIMPMAEPHTKIIIIGTVQRDDDIYSVDFTSTGKRAISVSYDAIVDEEKKLTLFPEKWDWETLMQRKLQISAVAGIKFFDKEYRNRPVNLLGEIIKQEWRRDYETLPTTCTSFYSGWDLSVGNKVDEGDYTAKITIAVDYSTTAPLIYIWSAYRDRIDIGARIRKIFEHGVVERPLAIGVEDNVFQTDTLTIAKKNSNLNIVPVHTTKSKIEKYNLKLAPLFENGRIFLKNGDPMTDIIWQELCSLPRGEHDDLADALCNAIDQAQVLSQASDYAIIV